MVLSDHSFLRALADSPYQDYDDPFNARHAEQVKRAFSDILKDMCVLRLVLDRMNILHRTTLTNEP